MTPASRRFTIILATAAITISITLSVIVSILVSDMIPKNSPPSLNDKSFLALQAQIAKVKSEMHQRMELSTTMDLVLTKFVDNVSSTPSSRELIQSLETLEQQEKQLKEDWQKTADEYLDQLTN